MNVHEFQIERLQKVIKKIEENPDPTKLRSNLMLYEIQLEGHKAQLEAMHQGTPQMGQPPGIGLLFQAMGYVCISGTQEEMSTQAYTQKYLEIARTKGFPVDTSCDMAMGMIAPWVAGEQEERISHPVCDQPCTPIWLTNVFRSHVAPNPRYYLDLGFEQNEATLKHTVNQLREYIEVCEKRFPGLIKYDEDKLIELQAYKEEIESYFREIYQMQRLKPSPLAGKEAFRQTGPIPPGMSPNPKKGVEYARMRRDEVAERVAKGIAAVPGEQLRMIWTVTRPWFMNPFKVLEKRKAAVLLHYWGPTFTRIPLPQTNFWGDRKLSPLEKVAAELLSSLWTGTSTRWVDNLIWIAKDLQVDAIINYNMVGCTATLGLKKPVEEQAEKIGVAVLQLEGKQWDSNYASEATINAKLDEFAQMLLSKKGLD